MELSPEEEARMWRENYGKLNLELQAEQQKRIWFENRYNEIVRALQTLQAAQQPLALDAAKSWRCECGFDMAIDAVKCIACGSPRK